MLRLEPGVRIALKEAASLYAENLSEVAPYLEERGIPEMVAEGFQFGYVKEPYSTEHQQYVGRLSIPYLTRAGVATLRFRCVQNHDCKTVGCAKYLSLPKVELPLYNVASFFQAEDVIVVCEGEFDAAVCSAMVGVPAVGCPGASLWKPHFTACVADYQTVLIVGDGDEAGSQMVERLSDEIPNGRGIVMPPGADINSLYLSKGREGVLSVLGL